MGAVLRILNAAGARIEPIPVRMGKSVYESGISTGIPAETWDALLTHRLLLKAPITTPSGGGYKSLNVTLRKTLGLYANVRPCEALTPYVPSMFPNMDVVIIRENEEDLYAGIEHQQTPDVVQCLKLITRSGCERIVRYAFEYARSQGRQKVTCLTKDNIMKLTDGLFHRVFNEVANEYPEIQTDHLIVDIGMARVATQPDRFDVLVTPNLYGDIVSDIAAELTGSVGLAGSSNIGPNFAMFEAIHGSAPDIAGQNVANPSGLLRAACMMLAHIGQADIAQRIHGAWLKTLEDGLHTADIFEAGRSQQRVSTTEFAEAVIARLGQTPNLRTVPNYQGSALPALRVSSEPAAPAVRELVGVDVFVHAGHDLDALGQQLISAAGPEWPLQMITSRGVKVWPNPNPDTILTDHFRCRFELKSPTTNAAVVQLLGRIVAAGVDVIKTENLYTFDGKAGYTLGQGQ